MMRELWKREPWRLALAAGILLGVVCLAQLSGRGIQAGDFTWPLRAGAIVREGGDPYAAMVNEGEYPYDAPFYYPIWAALLAAPFSWLPFSVAGAVFFGLGAGAMMWAVLKYRPELWPAFLSAPFFMALWLCQWSPWVFAAALVPDLMGVAICKPNVGLAAFAYRPTWRGAWWMALMVMAGFYVMPAWPGEWTQAIASQVQHVPLAAILPVGVLALLAGLWNWRRGEGRVLAALMIVPQLPFFYDQLLIWLFPRTWKEALGLSVLSWVGFGLYAAGWASAMQAVMWWVVAPGAVVVWRSKCRNS